MMDTIRYENLTIRQAEAADAKQLAAWWNDGAVMAHAGFPNGVGTTEEKVAKGLGKGSLVIQENDRLIGECNYRDVGVGVAEIGIKICERDRQEHGLGRIFLSMLLKALFAREIETVVLDTDLENRRAQHVYELLGFTRLGVRRDCWRNQVGELRSAVDYAIRPDQLVDYARE